MKISNFFIFLSLFLIYACNSNTVIDQIEELPQSGWNYENIPAFEFEISETNFQYNAFLNIQISEQFAYRNLYLVMHLRNKEGKETTNRINVELSDSEGNWVKNSGSGNQKTFKIPVAENMTFEHAGRYVIGIEQNTRDSSLLNVNQVGIEIQKGNPVF
jgi:gliding motility-associated lipoprotein GldH